MKKENLINQIKQGTVDSKKTDDFVRILKFITKSNIKPCTK